MQKTLIVTTKRPNLRSEICGWTVEDSDLFNSGKSIGFTGNPDMPAYNINNLFTYPETVLEAQYHGWKLLAPPTRNVFRNPDGKLIVTYEWWLVQD